MTPTVMQAKAGQWSPVTWWYSPVLVSVEPSVLKHLPTAERRLLLLQDRELHSQQIIAFFLLHFDSQTVGDWIRSCANRREL